MGEAKLSHPTHLSTYCPWTIQKLRWAIYWRIKSIHLITILQFLRGSETDGANLVSDVPIELNAATVTLKNTRLEEL